MKKKIVLIVEAMLGGVRRHVCDLIKNLNCAKYEIYLIYSSVRADNAFYSEIKCLEKHATLICCDDMRRSLGKADYVAYGKIVNILDRIKPDIVHCHSSKAGIVGRLAAKKSKVPWIVYTPHAYAFQNPEIQGIKKMIYVCAEKFLSWYATDITINVSEGERKQAEKCRLNKDRKSILIYNGIAPIECNHKKEIRQEIGLKDGTYYIGVASRCVKQKDPMTFLKIARKIVQTFDSIEFLYVGDGVMYKDMKQWITCRHLDDKIHMLGFREDAEKLIEVLDLYLSTSVYEGLPYSMLEAMRAGVPVIAADVEGNHDLVSEGENGWLFPAGNIDRACELITRQYQKNEIKEENVKNTFTNRFLLDTMMNQLNKVYAYNGERGRK